MPLISRKTSTLLQKRGVQKEHITLVNSRNTLSRIKGLREMRGGKLTPPVKASVLVTAKRLLFDKKARVKRVAFETLLALGKEEAFMQLERELVRGKSPARTINMLNRIYYSRTTPKVREQIYQFIQNKIMPKVRKGEIKLTDKQYSDLTLMALQDIKYS